MESFCAWEWCRRSVAGDRRLSFELAAVASPYGSHSGVSAGTYRFPMEDEGAGLIPAKSVFTHLFEEDERSRFFEMASNAGLPVQWMSAGYFPGSDRLTGQDILLLGL